MKMSAATGNLKPKIDQNQKVNPTMSSSTATAKSQTPSTSTLQKPAKPPNLLAKYRPFQPIPPFSSKSRISKDDINRLLNEPISVPAAAPPIKPISYVIRTTNSTASSNRPIHPREEILGYVYDWAAWAAEIPDAAKRDKMLAHVMGTMERVLKEGIERRMLGAQDIGGIINGRKMTIKGEVEIEVSIKSRARFVEKKSDGDGKKDAQNNPIRASTNTGVDQHGNGKVASPGPTAEHHAAIDGAPQASLSSGIAKGKRAAGEMEGSQDATHDTKKQKMEDDGRKIENQTTTGADGAQDREENGRPEGITGAQEDKTSDNMNNSGSDEEMMTPEEEEKRTRYRQQIFMPRLNTVLKKAGKSAARGKCKKWDTVKERLTDAGVDVKHRNMMFRDFHLGYEKWDGDPEIDSNVELALFAKRFGRSPSDNAANVSNKVGPRDKAVADGTVKPKAKREVSATEDVKKVGEALKGTSGHGKGNDSFAFNPVQPVSAAVFILLSEDSRS